jgi:hypothetical protein
MNKTVSDLLSSLLQIVSFYDEQIGNNLTDSQIIRNPEFAVQIGYVKRLYESLPGKDREEFFSILDQEFEDEVSLHVYLFSFMLKAVHSRDIIDQLVRVICRGKLDVYTGVELEFQLLIEINRNYEPEEMYELQRRLHSYNSTAFRKACDSIMCPILLGCTRSQVNILG